MNLHKPMEVVTDANVALQMLKEGNDRFVKNQLAAKDSYAGDRAQFTGGQKPYAVVVCCADSRVSPEIFFDQKLGDIFVIRNAGNVVDQTVLGSIEYAAEHLGSPLVVVCGHTSCGAVTAAYEGGEVPVNIGSIVNRIKPAVGGGRSLDEVIKVSAKNMTDLVKDDEIIKHLGTTVVTACYDVVSGVVSWL